MATFGDTILTRGLGVLLFLAAGLPVYGRPGQDYVGAKACATCHSDINHKWAASLHGRMMEVATPQSVEGDFGREKIELGGLTYVLERRNSHYYITESYLTGKPWEHQIDYSLGNRRVQEYLTTLGDGRIIVLPAAWDNARKVWRYEADIHNPEDDRSAPVQLWNKTCYPCHVSREQKNFDLQNLAYQTTWQDLGIDCESCHGPGAEHVAKASSARTMSDGARATIDKMIMNPARLDSMRSTMICAQCHSLRDIYVDSFKAGANYYDFFLPVMEYRLPASDDPAYWPDGRPRWLSNEVLALWQSACFLKGGSTCVTCHSDAHSVDVGKNRQLGSDNDALCTRCHSSVGANISAHTHHLADSAGSSCIECHMPGTVISLNARMRDHSMSVPVPENTIRHDIPNACNLCHKDKSAEWASTQMNAWYGERDQSRQKLIRRADAFSEARKGNPAAIPPLLQILADPSGGPLIRANAAGYLGNFPDDPSAYDAVLRAFSDAEPLVRATAVVAIKPRAAQREAVAPKMAPLLSDPVATVQMSAAIALVAIGARQLPSEDRAAFDRAKALYRGRAELNLDDAQLQFAAGKFFFLAGDADAAIEAFRASLKVDDTIPAQYYLARALAEQGDPNAARQILQSIPRDDPQYAPAQELLAALELNASDHGGAPQQNIAAPESAGAEASFADGQFQYQNRNYGAALDQLEKALRLAPQAAWATKARIYRAICLEKLARTTEAEAAMQELARDPAARDDVDLQLAFAELLFDTGRSREALKHVDDTIALAPRAPMAHFWRAKILLQLQRTDEAAKAAEESVRLLPENPAAHNLLVRIYQLQGRTREAAQEVEWLREYQRRIESQ